MENSKPRDLDNKIITMQEYLEHDRIIERWYDQKNEEWRNFSDYERSYQIAACWNDRYCITLARWCSGIEVGLREMPDKKFKLFQGSQHHILRRYNRLASLVLAKREITFLGDKFK